MIKLKQNKKNDKNHNATNNRHGFWYMDSRKQQPNNYKCYSVIYPNELLKNEIEYNV